MFVHVTYHQQWSEVISLFTVRLELTTILLGVMPWQTYGVKENCVMVQNNFTFLLRKLKINIVLFQEFVCEISYIDM